MGDPTESELRSMVTSSDCTIDFNEFMSSFQRKLIDSDTEEELVEAFKTFDLDENGTISADELKYVMTNMGENLSDNEIEEMIVEGDVDGDGLISYEEFVRMMLK